MQADFIKLDNENYIKKSRLFDGLSPSQVSRLDSIATIKKYKKDALIFSEGEEASGFYIVIDGKVKIYKLSAQGKEYILHIASSGDTIAEVTLFSGSDYPAYAQPISACSLLFFPKHAFLEITREYPEVGMRILKAVAGRQRKFADTIEDLSLRGVECRLAKYLFNLAKEKGKNNFELGMQKSELAMKLGTVPETLSRNLLKLKTKKLISLKDRSVCILNPSGLGRIAGIV